MPNTDPLMSGAGYAGGSTMDQDGPDKHGAAFAAVRAAYGDDQQGCEDYDRDLMRVHAKHLRIASQGNGGNGEEEPDTEEPEEASDEDLDPRGSEGAGELVESQGSMAGSGAADRRRRAAHDTKNTSGLLKRHPYMRVTLNPFGR